MCMFDSIKRAVEAAKRVAFRVGMVVTPVVLVATAKADGTAPDLTPITTGLSGLGTAVLAIAGTVIAGALSLFAIKRGGKWVLGLWKSFVG
jgi:type IV secretory pathway VirB2 component (pilin)